MICTFCKNAGPNVAVDGHRDEVRTLRLTNGRIVTSHFSCAQSEDETRAEDIELRQAEDQERVASEEARG